MEVQVKNFRIVTLNAKDVADVQMRSKLRKPITINTKYPDEIKKAARKLIKEHAKNSTSCFVEFDCKEGLVACHIKQYSGDS